MSNIYIQEPSTTAKVVLVTTVGDIDIELWSRECPNACRNFIQLCLEGYYNDTIFHRVVKDFIVQGGDPNGDGTGGESIYGEPFKDEFHSRLRYTRRGLVGMANSDKDENGSQFFFTMSAASELQNKNTLFGKVTGDTIFNMLKLQEGLVDQNERPMYPQKILRATVLNNPFDDIVPRVMKKEERKEKRKRIEKGVKNFGLLSFGEEAEEDEEETNVFVQKNLGKAKSLHDASDDPNLSKNVANMNQSNEEIDDHLADDLKLCIQNNDLQPIENLNDDGGDRALRVQKKLKEKKLVNNKTEIRKNLEESDIESDDMLLTYEEGHKIKNDQIKEKLRQDILDVKKEYQTNKKLKMEMLEDKKSESNKTKLIENVNNNDLIHNYMEERKKYKTLCSKIPTKGAGREEFTLNLLAKFRTKLNNIKQKEDGENEVQPDNNDDVEKEIESGEWMTHKLNFQDNYQVLARDASTKSDDWYDVYDPRNPLNKRKRIAKTQNK